MAYNLQFLPQMLTIVLCNILQPFFLIFCLSLSLLISLFLIIEYLVKMRLTNTRYLKGLQMFNVWVEYHPGSLSAGSLLHCAD